MKYKMRMTMFSIHYKTNAETVFTHVHTYWLFPDNMLHKKLRDKRTWSRSRKQFYFVREKNVLFKWATQTALEEIVKNSTPFKYKE